MRDAPRQSNAHGLLLMGLAMFLFSAADTQAKVLTETLHPIQIVWCRQIGLLTGALYFLSRNGSGILRSSQPKLQLLRGGLAIGSAVFFVMAIKFVPIADAVAVSFIAPFIVTILGAILLGEAVGIHRWSAVILGFIGALIVIRPGMGAIHPASLLVVVAATFFAARQVLSRYLSRHDRTETTVFYTAIITVGLLTLPLPFVWTWPTSRLEVILLVSFALMAGTGEILVIKALELAESVVVAPVQYSLLIWGTIYGFVVFGDFPDIWTWIGALIIVATGIYTLHRERLKARMPREQ